MIGKWGARILTHISRIEARGVGAKFQATLVTDDTNGQIRGRGLRREVRGKGREEVLFEVRCGGCVSSGAINGVSELNRATNREAYAVQIS